MSKTILTEVEGWTPLIDEIVQAHGIMVAAVFGRMWRYCQMERGVCDASLEKIADELNISRMTVIRHIEVLVQGGYLIDQTPDLRNKPHTYSDAGKVEMRSSISAVSKSNSPKNGVTKCDGDSNNLLHPPVTKSDLKKGSLRDQEERESPDPFDVFQRICEGKGIVLTGETDIKALTAIVNSGASADDLKAGIDWKAANNGGRAVLRVSQIVGPTQTATAKRLQAVAKKVDGFVPAEVW